MKSGQSCCARHNEPRRQNGQYRAFSRSRRAAGFLLHTFLSPPKEKCERPMGRQVPIRAGVGASSPIKGEFLRQSCLLLMPAGGFPLAPLHPFGSPLEAIERPIGLQALPSRRSRRVRPRQRGISSAKLSLVMPAGGFPLAPCTPSESRHANGIKEFAPTDTPNGFPRGKHSARPSLSENPHRNIFPSGNPPSFPLGKPQLSPHCRTF